MILSGPKVAVMRFCCLSVSQLSLERNNEIRNPKRLHEAALRRTLPSCDGPFGGGAALRGATLGDEITDEVSVGTK